MPRFYSDYWTDPETDTRELDAVEAKTVITLQQANAACNLAAQWYYQQKEQPYQGWGSDSTDKSQMPWFLRAISHAARRLKFGQDFALCALWSRCMQETGAAWYREEQKSDEECERLYGYQTSKGKELGNTEPGDGALYKGRGVIQLTGKNNYRNASEALQVDMVSSPELALLPQNAGAVIEWYLLTEMPSRHSWNTPYPWLLDQNLSLEERSYRVSACINWGYFRPWDRRPTKEQINGWDMTQMYGVALATILGLEVGS